MNTSHLRHFISVYDLLSIRQAAKQLNMAQSTISKSIQKLEADMSVTLFERHTRYIKPTQAAHLLYRHANQCICAEDDMLAEARFLSQGDSGIIYIGCGAFAHDLVLRPLIETLLKSQSTMRIHARIEAFDMLKKGLDSHFYHALLCDMGDLKAVQDPSDYEVTPLLKLPVHIVANESHPVHQHKNPLLHLLEYKLILPPVPQRYLNMLPEHLRDFILRSDKPDFETTNLDQAIKLAKNNELITAVAGEIKDDGTVSDTGLKAVKLPENLPFSLSTDIGLWRFRKRLMTPQLKELLANLTKHR